VTPGSRASDHDCDAQQARRSYLVGLSDRDLGLKKSMVDIAGVMG
jgi:hypothetical protein